jgi:hypothetical protein
MAVYCFAELPKIEYDAGLRHPLSIKGGTSLIIDVDLLGVPAPKLTWAHNSVPLERSAQVAITEDDTHSTLHIRNTAALHSGTYTLTATNKAGSDKATFTVLIKGTGLPEREGIG